MDNIKKMFYLLIRQLKMSFSRKRIWAGYMLGIAMVMQSAWNYKNFIGNHTANIVEAFLNHYMSFGNITVMLFGFIIVLSEAPFVYADSFMMIHRVGRKCWYHAMWLYIVVQGACYYIICFLTSILFFIKKGYLQNIWSQPLRYLIQYNQIEKISQYHITVPDEKLIQNYTPYNAFIHTFLLFFLYSMVLAGLLFALNMYRYSVLGTVMVALVHVIGVFMNIMAPFIGKISRFSLVANAVFEWHLEGNKDLLFSYILFFFCILVIYIIGGIVIKRTDFNVIESEYVDE